mmetsp:Transcript_9183/g.33659  ORF Transcript_9183/g.33659 Transcript_9183/m.33659 type:complete len:236 (-) Transcript_9183:1720-2427(-)
MQGTLLRAATISFSRTCRTVSGVVVSISTALHGVRAAHEWSNRRRPPPPPASRRFLLCTAVTPTVAQNWIQLEWDRLVQACRRNNCMASTPIREIGVRLARCCCDRRGSLGCRAASPGGTVSPSRLRCCVEGRAGFVRGPPLTHDPSWGPRGLPHGSAGLRTAPRTSDHRLRRPIQDPSTTKPKARARSPAWRFTRSSRLATSSVPWRPGRSSPRAAGPCSACSAPSARSGCRSL